MRNKKVKIGKSTRYIHESKQIWGKKGYLKMRVEFWSTDEEGNIISGLHSVHNTHSKRTWITNNTFRKLYANCIKIGRNLHIQKFKKNSNEYITHHVIWYKIIYDTLERVTTKFRKGKLKVSEKNKKSYIHIQDKEKRKKADEYYKRQEKRRINEYRKYQELYMSDKEYNAYIKSQDKFRKKIREKHQA